MKIFKYVLPISGSFNLQMPVGAKVLKVGTQNGLAFLWAEVHPEGDFENIKMYCHGTGHEIPQDGREHVGTVLIQEWVWHFYRGKK